MCTSLEKAKGMSIVNYHHFVMTRIGDSARKYDKWRANYAELKTATIPCRLIHTWEEDDWEYLCNV